MIMIKLLLTWLLLFKILTWLLMINVLLTWLLIIDLLTWLLAFVDSAKASPIIGTSENKRQSESLAMTDN